MPQRLCLPWSASHRRPELCLPGVVHADRPLPVAEVEAVEVGAVEGVVVVVGRGEGAVVDPPQEEAPLCPAPSRGGEEQEQEEPRVTTGEGEVVGTGMVLDMSLT